MGGVFALGRAVCFANLLVPPTKTSERHEPREKKANLKVAEEKASSVLWYVLGGCQKSGAPHKMWKFYTSTTTIEINFE